MKKTVKVVVNDGLINYGLNETAYKQMGLDWEKMVVWPMEKVNPDYKGLLAGMVYKDDRSNSKLVGCVETLGPEGCGIPGTYFIIVEVSKDFKWEIVPRILGGEDLVISKV